MKRRALFAACGLVVLGLFGWGMWAVIQSKQDVCRFDPPRRMTGGYIWTPSGPFSDGDAQFFLEYVGKRALTGTACSRGVRVPEVVYVERMYGLDKPAP